ncbi:MAG: Proline-rich protein 12 [Icmadophila ericetorum]|nr:Proline-rich protein 12 [Icmadophila ericetorum]
MDQTRTQKPKEEMPNQPKTPTTPHAPVKKRAMPRGKKFDLGAGSSSQPPKKRGRPVPKVARNALTVDDTESEDDKPSSNIDAKKPNSSHTRPGQVTGEPQNGQPPGGPESLPSHASLSKKHRPHPHQGGKAPQLRPASTQAPLPSTPLTSPSVVAGVPRPTIEPSPLTPRYSTGLRYPPYQYPCLALPPPPPPPPPRPTIPLTQSTDPRPLPPPANPLHPHILDLVTATVGISTIPQKRAGTLCLSTCPPLNDIPLGGIYSWLAAGIGIKPEFRDIFKMIIVTYPWKKGMVAGTQVIRYQHLANDLEVMCMMIREKWLSNRDTFGAIGNVGKLIHIEMEMRIYRDDPDPGFPVFEAGPGRKS